MLKIKKFRSLILEGRTLKEAQEESGIAGTTSKREYYLMKKEGILNQEKEDEQENN